MRARLAVSIALGLLVFGANVALSEGKPPSLPEGWAFKTNFDIPDAPAFQLLGVDPSTILRPQTARDLALQMAKFQGDQGGFALPRALAVEFSPALLANRSAEITTEKYRKYHYYYATRLSLAALRDSVNGQTARLALGARISLVDEKSLKSDRDYEKDFHVTPMTAEILAIQSAASKRAIANRPASVPVDELDTYEAEAAKKDDFYTEDEKQQLKELWKTVRSRMAARYWNKTVLDLAFAGRGSASDSTGQGMKLDALSAWASYSHGWGSWSQLVFGLRMGSTRDSVGKDYEQNMSIAGRFYAGSAQAKAFVEFQNTVSSGRDAVWFLNSGLEASPTDWIWLDFSAGVEKSSSGTSHSTVSFKLKTALPGL